MISVPAAFTASELAPVNYPQSKVFLVLGNYCTQNITASNIDVYSSDYPAYGMCDGDRTELNVGPASGADDGVGLSCWRSINKPNAGSNVAFAQISFNQSRKINRIKIYHHSSHPLKEYAIYSVSSYYTGGFQIAATTGFYSISNPLVTFISNQTLDIIDLPSDYSTYGLYIIVSDVVHHGEEAYVVEMEAYRKVDISSRVSNVEVDRSRDFKLANPIASYVTIDVNNTDRFFSFNHVPTAAEMAAGFINQELVPGIGIIVQFGFNNYFVNYFTGTMDKITVSSATKTGQITGRDGMKALINQTFSTKLKMGYDLGAASGVGCVQYVLNLCNIANGEMAVDQTTILIDRFFFNDNALTIIQKLQEAAGDAIFFFDENGIATFRSYLGNIPQQTLWTTKADFESGIGAATANLATIYPPDEIQKKWLLVTHWGFAWWNFIHVDGYVPPWTFQGDGVNGNSKSIISGDGSNVLHVIAGNGGAIWTARKTSTQMVGTWDMRFQSENSGYLQFAYFTFISPAGATGNGDGQCYYVFINALYGTIYLYYMDTSRIAYSLGSAGATVGGGYHSLRVSRDISGNFKVYWDGTLKISATDTNFTGTNAYIYLSAVEGVFDFGDLYFSPSIEPSAATTNVQTIYESRVLDQTASVVGEGLIQYSFTLGDIGTGFTFYTATSSDGTSFPDGYVACGVGNQILSTPRRYIKWKVVFNNYLDSGPYNEFIPNKAVQVIYDVTVNWFTGTATQKYPASSSYTFRFDGTITDLQQEYADNIGGDSSVYNDVQVQSTPLILQGNDVGSVSPPPDVVWQSTTSVPAVPVDGAHPISIVNGTTLYYPLVISSGMDVSRMSGSQTAAVVTFASGGAGTVTWDVIKPISPRLKIVVTATGTITNLLVEGLTYNQSSTGTMQEASDAGSINQYGLRQLPIQNEFIINDAMALFIAKRLLAIFLNAKSYIPSISIRPTFALQLGDRVTIIDLNLDLSNDYIVVGVTQNFSTSDVSTDLVLLKVMNV